MVAEIYRVDGKIPFKLGFTSKALATLIARELFFLAIDKRFANDQMIRILDRRPYRMTSLMFFHIALF